MDSGDLRLQIWDFLSLTVAAMDEKSLASIVKSQM